MTCSHKFCYWLSNWNIAKTGFLLVAWNSAGVVGGCPVLVLYGRACIRV
jgi:hypothetical protein